MASLSQHHSVSGIGGNIGGTVGGGVGVNAQTNRVNEEAQSAAGAFQMPYAFPHPVVSSFMPPPASSAPSVVSNGVAVNSSPATAGQQQAGSASSSSSEGSASSQQTWSFEEQFKQVRQVSSASFYTTLEFAFYILDENSMLEKANCEFLSVV